MLVGRIAGPALLTVAPYVACIYVNRAVVEGSLPPGRWLWLLVVPGLAVEWVASCLFDAGFSLRKGRRRFFAVSLLRWATFTLFFYLTVGRGSSAMHTPDLYYPLVRYWLEVVPVPFRASPVLGSFLLLALAAAYGWFTVRQRRWRYTTSVLVPAAATVGLFMFWYTYPTSAAHLFTMQPSPPVEQVFPLPGGTPDAPEGLHPPFYPRDLYVLKDETALLATYGPTFRGFVAGGLHPNLLKIDLSRNAVEVRNAPPIRQISTTCEDRVYAGPWWGSSVLEITPSTFEVNTIDLPREANGFPVEEFNHVHHDCESNRVYALNSRNPVLFVWNTATRSLEKMVNLTDIEGIVLGDSTVVVRTNPTTGRIYVFGALGGGRWEFVEIDSSTFQAVRLGTLPGSTFDSVLSPDGTWIYSTAVLAGKAWKVDADTLSAQMTYRIPLHCRRIRVTDDGRAAIAISYVTGEIVSYDTTTGRRLAKYWVGPKAVGLFLSRHYAWVSAATGIFRIPLTDLTSPE